MYVALTPLQNPKIRAAGLLLVAIAVSVYVAPYGAQFANYVAYALPQAQAWVSVAVVAVGTATLVYITIVLVRHVKTRVVATPPGVRMAGGMTYTMETVAGFVIGVLVVGIILGVFILLSNMQFNINGTRYTLIPAQISSLTQSTTLTLISIIIVVAIVVILIPVVKYLMDLFGRSSGR